METESRKNKGLQMIAAFVFMLFLLVGGYLAGAYSSYFEANICYAQVIEVLSRESVFVAAQKDDTALMRYKAFLSTLPVGGSATDCAGLLEMINSRKTAPSE